MEIEVNLREVRSFVTEELPDLLTNNTTDFTISAFILQTLLNKLDELEELEER